MDGGGGAMGNEDVLCEVGSFHHHFPHTPFIHPLLLPCVPLIFRCYTPSFTFIQYILLSVFPHIVS